VEDAGDEPSWLAESLPGVAVVVGEKRYQAGLLALSEVQPDLFILDDGFSHLALRRNLDLVVLPGDDPLGGGLLPPGGRLREPLAALSRAHAVLLTVSPGGPDGEDQDRALAETLADHGFLGPLFRLVREPGQPRWADGSPVARGTAVLLVSGVGRPESVARAAQASGLRILDHLVFPDHCRYSPRALRALEEKATTMGARAILTTGKDRVKLMGRATLPLAELPLSVEPEASFWTWLHDTLDGTP
jgi:tetraacyldisaccharide 4'-kinase